MTASYQLSRARGLCRQLLMVILINVPTVSLGMAMGWISLVSGEHGADADAGAAAGAGAGSEEAGARVVAAAATTFLASLVGVPLSAKALTYGRKFAIIATSACFVVCWGLKLAGGGWWVVAARVAAGLGGAGAYSISPLVAREMCERRVRGAAAAALVLAHNVGFLLMYLAADFAVPQRTVLWASLGVSLAHCALFLAVPESPAFLAANGRHEEAASSLAWLRGAPAGHPALAAELAALPPPQPPTSPAQLLKAMFSDANRRRAFIIVFVAIVGQEACGVYTLMQFAERTFVLARDQPAHAAEHAPRASALAANRTSGVASLIANETTSSDLFLSDVTGPLAHALMSNTSEAAAMVGAVNASIVDASGALMSPARQAVVLGAVQLLASAVALYLVERVGRRRLLILSAFATCGCLALAAAAVRWGGAWAGAALAGAVAADNVGLQPAPYALLADMFHYEYRAAALMVSSAAACAANALEVALFPLVAARGGLAPALALAAALTAAYALFALRAVPETRGKAPEEIYRLWAARDRRPDNDVHVKELKVPDALSTSV